MDKQAATKIKVAGWFGLAVSIVCFAIYLLKMGSGGDPSPALVVVGIAAGLGACTILAGVKKQTRP